MAINGYHCGLFKKDLPEHILGATQGLEKITLDQFKALPLNIQEYLQEYLKDDVMKSIIDHRRGVQQ